MALTGNSYAQILRNSTGLPVGLYPLDPRITEPVRLPTGKIGYKTAVGAAAGSTIILAASDVLHFPLFSFDGLKGLSPIGQARNGVGLAIAAEKYGAKFFGNNSVPPALLTPVGDVSEEDLNNMRQFWEKANSATNQGRIGILPSDWKLTQLSMSPEDSQYLESRQFSRTDIAALFRVPPSYVGDTTGSAKANHEQQSLDFVVNTLRPYLVRIEVEIKRKLLPADGSLFAEFDCQERLRGDFQTTMAGYATGKQWGWYTTNTILEKLGENPVGPEGDILWAPVNMINAARLLNTEPIAVEPLPGTDQTPPTPADVPTEQQRSMFDSYIPAFAGLFRDAVGTSVATEQEGCRHIGTYPHPGSDLDCRGRHHRSPRTVQVCQIRGRLPTRSSETT